ncbi:Phytanoyl-CoA dioxygenase [Balamuthia mandrillaris]
MGNSASSQLKNVARGTSSSASIQLASATPAPQPIATSYTPKQVPLDEEGYVHSFSLDDDPQALLDFFQEFGFVVVDNVLDPEDCDRTIDEIWQLVSNSFPGLEKEDPHSWERLGKGGAGIVGMDIVDGVMAWTNRQNANLYKAFSLVLGTKKLMVSMDRYGMMRPTKNIPFPSRQEEGTEEKGKKKEEEKEEADKEGGLRREDRPEWKTRSAWVHWDLNPWGWFHVGEDETEEKEKEAEKRKKAKETLERWKLPHTAAYEFITENNENNEFKGYEKVQGLIALADSKVEDGGFLTVPGFHKFTKEWAEKHPKTSSKGFIMVPSDDPLIQHVFKVSMRRGSLVIWSSAMPHCNYPNDSDKFRFCQYLKMFPADVMPYPESELGKARAEAVRLRLPNEFVPSPLGRKMLGLEPWSDDEDDDKILKETKALHD